jgi:predicted GNAT family acetyltransferase
MEKLVRVEQNADEDVEMTRMEVLTEIMEDTIRGKGMNNAPRQSAILGARQKKRKYMDICDSTPQDFEFQMEFNTQVETEPEFEHGQQVLSLNQVEMEAQFSESTFDPVLNPCAERWDRFLLDELESNSHMF